MTDEKTWLTCTDAAKLLNRTQRHVLNLIKKKNISHERDESGKYFIQAAEFFRVFPNAMKQEKTGNNEKLIEEGAMKLLEEKIKHLEEMVNEKKKHNEFLAEQLGNFTVEKSKMLDAINHHARLLEYKESKEVNSNATEQVNNKAENKLFNWRKLFGKG